MLFILITVILILNSDMCKAHVYCQDEHATEWTALGHSCPINCASVVGAVKRLKQIEYEAMFDEKEAPRLNDTITISEENIDQSNSRRNDIYSAPSIKRPKQLDYSHYLQFRKILQNPKAVKELHAILKNYKKTPDQLFNGTCHLFRKLIRGKKYKNIEKINQLKMSCARRCEIEKDFLKVFTVTLNKYTTNEHSFDEDLTQIILEKVLGTGMELRHGVFDVEKLLNFLQESIAIHSKHAKKRSNSITLKSRFCLNVYVPGCYCLTGFVEKNGQCVKPSDCFDDPYSVLDYLARIVVL